VPFFQPVPPFVCPPPSGNFSFNPPPCWVLIFSFFFFFFSATYFFWRGACWSFPWLYPPSPLPPSQLRFFFPPPRCPAFVCLGRGRTFQPPLWVFNTFFFPSKGMRPLVLFPSRLTRATPVLHPCACLCDSSSPNFLWPPPITPLWGFFQRLSTFLFFFFFFFLWDFLLSTPRVCERPFSVCLTPRILGT